MVEKSKENNSTNERNLRRRISELEKDNHLLCKSLEGMTRLYVHEYERN